MTEAVQPEPESPHLPGMPDLEVELPATDPGGPDDRGNEDVERGAGPTEPPD